MKMGYKIIIEDDGELIELAEYKNLAKTIDKFQKLQDKAVHSESGVYDKVTAIYIRADLSKV